jgi:hypothetical protein
MQVRAVIHITAGLEWLANRVMVRRSNMCISTSNSSAGRHSDRNWSRKLDIQFVRKSPTLPVFSATSGRAISNIRHSRSKRFSCAARRNSDFEHRISSYHACSIPLCSVQYHATKAYEGLQTSLRDARLCQTGTPWLGVGESHCGLHLEEVGPSCIVIFRT